MLLWCDQVVVMQVAVEQRRGTGHRMKIRCSMKCFKEAAVVGDVGQIRPVAITQNNTIEEQEERDRKSQLNLVIVVTVKVEEGGEETECKHNSILEICLIKYRVKYTLTPRTNNPFQNSLRTFRRTIQIHQLQFCCNKPLRQPWPSFCMEKWSCAPILHMTAFLSAFI